MLYFAGAWIHGWSSFPNPCVLCTPLAAHQRSLCCLNNLVASCVLSTTRDFGCLPVINKSSGKVCIQAVECILWDWFKTRVKLHLLPVLLKEARQPHRHGG